MQYLQAFLGLLKAFSFITSCYQKWRETRQQEYKQAQVKQINEKPHETFANEFGHPSGCVRVTLPKKQLPTHTGKP